MPRGKAKAREDGPANTPDLSAHGKAKACEDGLANAPDLLVHGDADQHDSSGVKG